MAEGLSVADILNWVRKGVLKSESEILDAYDVLKTKIRLERIVLNGNNRFLFEYLTTYVNRIRSDNQHPSNQQSTPWFYSLPSTSRGFSEVTQHFDVDEFARKEAEKLLSSDISDNTDKTFNIDDFSQNEAEKILVYGDNQQVDIEAPIQRGGILYEDKIVNHSKSEPQCNVESVLTEKKSETPKFHYINLVSEGSKKVKKFNLLAKSLKFHFKDVEETANPVTWLQNAFDEIIKYATTGALPTDRVGLVLRNENFAEKPIGISYRRVDQLSSKVVMATLEKVLQSNATFFANDLLQLQVGRVTLPVGRGRQKMTGVTFADFCRRRRGIISVINYDTLCLAKAVVVAKAWRDNDPSLSILQLGGELLDQKSRDLCIRARVDLSDGGTREHIQKFQDYFENYTIVVYNNRLGKSVYFEGPREPNRQVLNLILENEHYNVIKSLTAAFAIAHFCELCRTRTNASNRHKFCKYTCPCCHCTPPCNKGGVTIDCDECNRDFRGEICFNNHIRTQLCTSLKRCNTCLYSVWLNKTHKCGYKYCFTCQKEKPIKHFCYMTPNKKKDLSKQFIFVFYDFECMQETPVAGKRNTYLHEPNLCIAQNLCAVCINNQNIDEDCCKCGKRQHIFKESPVQTFLNYISKLASKGSTVIALAHNMKGYDGTFIMKALVNDRHKWNPKIISTGTKIMSITCDKIKFLDSLNFLPVPLSKLPETFKFSGSKGYFPHLFNTTVNQNYIGPLPDTHYYMADEMSPSARCEFLEWYNSEKAKGIDFDMQRDIVAYCKQDVDILRKACIEFWRRYTSENGVDPFRESCTIAGSVNLVFRRNFLKADTIALLPPGGYRMADKQSTIAIKWLLWTEHTQGIQIQHAGNNREVRLIENILVDGFHQPSRTVYNFHGCYFHGCESCYPDQTADLSGLEGDTMFSRRERTEAMAKRIRMHGYNLVEIWECKFKIFLTQNIEAAEFVNNHAIVKNTPLNPRDSFFGGRTNAVKLYYKAEQNEEIKYLDVCSLYPYVNKYGKYPIGHPKLHIGNEECRKLCLTSVEGIIKCTVLPPQNLYHPVLPFRAHGKLMFILCRTCAQTLQQTECNHTQYERKFTGTYVADEIRKAVEWGYKVLEMHEIWEYKVEQYDRNSKRGGLFSKFVDNFIKLKQECSGWPSWCSNENLKERYINEYLDKEGVSLDKDKISVNPGLRYIAKSNLNSFWGKFAQRENLTQTSILSDPFELFKLMTDPSVEVHALTPIGDEIIVVNWVRPDEAIVPLKTVNVVLAAYTTANARLELYKYLEKLQKRVIYFDTDSVIFSQKPGEWEPPTGDLLGDMTDEMAEHGPGSKIIEFVSGGPKNYAFRYFSTNKNEYDVVCKVKGITLNYKNTQIVNFQQLKDMILNNAEAVSVETDRKISRTGTYDIVSKCETKIYQVKYNKRRRLEDNYDTIPYGFRE